MAARGALAPHRPLTGSEPSEQIRLRLVRLYAAVHAIVAVVVVVSAVAGAPSGWEGAIAGAGLGGILAGFGLFWQSRTRAGRSVHDRPELGILILEHMILTAIGCAAGAGYGLVFQQVICGPPLIAAAVGRFRASAAMAVASATGFAICFGLLPAMGVDVAATDPGATWPVFALLPLVLIVPASLIGQLLRHFERQHVHVVRQAVERERDEVRALEAMRRNRGIYHYLHHDVLAWLSDCATALDDWPPGPSRPHAAALAEDFDRVTVLVRSYLPVEPDRPGS